MISALKYIEEMPKDQAMLVTIRDYEACKTILQHSTYWKWITIIAKYFGDTKEEKHVFYKEKFLVPIFIRDDLEWAEMWETIRKCWRLGMKDDANILRKQVVRLASITQTTKKQMSEYLHEIDMDAAEHKIYLPRRDDETEGK